MKEGVLLSAGTFDCADMFYATRFLSYDPVTYLEIDGRSILAVPDLEVERATELPNIDEVWSYSEWADDALLRVLPDSIPTITLGAVRKAGLRRVVVPGWYPVSLADFLRANGIEVTVDSDVIARRRRHKHAHEIEAIAQSCRVAELSLAHARSLLARSEVMSNGELVLDGETLTSERLKGEIRSIWALNRSEGFTPLVVMGAQATMGEETGHGPLRAGEPIGFDLCPRHEVTRYYSDMTRSFCVGDSPDKLKRVHATVREALEVAKESCRPGVPGNQVYRRVREFFNRRGYPSLPLPSGADAGSTVHGVPYLGHGLGLEVHEATTGVEAFNTQVLEPGDVITLEPGLSQDGWGEVWLEDVIAITDGGCRTLTQFDYELSVDASVTGTQAVDLTDCDALGADTSQSR